MCYWGHALAFYARGNNDISAYFVIEMRTILLLYVGAKMEPYSSLDLTIFDSFDHFYHCATRFDHLSATSFLHFGNSHELVAAQLHELPEN